MNFDEVIKPDIAARRLAVNETGKVVCEWSPCRLSDLPSGYGRGLEPHMMVAAIHLDKNIDLLGMAFELAFLCGFVSGEILFHFFAPYFF
jgi:hypothetical protein